MLSTGVFTILFFFGKTSAVSKTDGWLKLNVASCVIRQSEKFTKRGIKQYISAILVRNETPRIVIYLVMLKFHES